MEPDLIGMPTGLNDNLCTAGPGTDHEDNLSCEFSRFSEIDRVHDPTTLSIPQPFVCGGISCPHWKAGIMIVSIRHCQVIEAPRNPRIVPQIMCQSAIEGNNLFPGPVC